MTMEPQTETKASTPVLEQQPTQQSIIPSRFGTAVSEWKPVEWNAERIDLARKTYAATATKEEFEFFIEWCRQTGLNPFLKQAFLIPRRQKIGDKWAEKHEPLAAEAGMAARADSMPDFRGMKAAVVYAGDTFGIDEVSQTIVHEWTLAERAKHGNRVVGAWAHAKREGREIEITYLTLESRIGKTSEGQATKFWATDPAGQLKKCARADQWRRAYPAIFNGVYIQEEMDRDEYEVNSAPVPTVVRPNGKSEALKERIKKAANQTVDASKAAPKKEAKQTTATIPIDCVRFGPFKGTLIKDVGSADLEEAIKEANRGLAQATGKEAWVGPVKEGIKAISDELDRREKEPVPEDEAPAPDENNAAPEPGSDG
jgi:phage recombination protein Bet